MDDSRLTLVFYSRLKKVRELFPHAELHGVGELGLFLFVFSPAKAHSIFHLDFLDILLLPDDMVTSSGVFYHQ